MKKLLPIILLLCACNQYPAQKTPFPIGTTVHFTVRVVGSVDPLKVKDYRLNEINSYDGSFHYFYTVTDASGKDWTHIIDYQLKK